MLATIPNGACWRLIVTPQTSGCMLAGCKVATLLKRKHSAFLERSMIDPPRPRNVRHLPESKGRPRRKVAVLFAFKVKRPACFDSRWPEPTT